MGSFEPGTVVRRREGLLSNELGPLETVMLDIERGTYFGVRHVAKDIWDRLEQPTVVEELVEDLRVQYEVDEETCRTDVDQFLMALADHGLLEVEPHGATA